jgi:hypothetical protein
LVSSKSILATYQARRKHRSRRRSRSYHLDGQATPAERGHELLLSLRRVDLSERGARGCTPKVLLLDLPLQYAGRAAQAAW